ncbi:MAG: AraC family transcriptional regulator [Lachnospiraceae bacterium]|nr:AraC family transcriptional regulator [Lachnospiraceae bacterium]
MKNESVYIEYADFQALRCLNHKNIELYLISCGQEACAPDHSFGPGARDKFLIHFVLSGKGEFRSNGQVYNLQKNQAFIIYPDREVMYKADSLDPWTYIWVGFHGTLVNSYLNSAGITEKTDVIDIPEDSSIPDIIKRMLKANVLTYSNELLRQALLLELLSTLISYKQDSGNESDSYCYPHAVYTEQAIRYIEKEYMYDISVVDIAKQIGITRSYLAKCFNNTVNMSPKQYIIKYRMEKACEFLKTTNMNITETAEAVGYTNSLTFSKAFKNYFGVSPAEWRNRAVSPDS